MKAEPKVSVVMPVFNAGRYLARAVESVLGQTFGNFEFIVIDDGSNDDSLATMRRYARHDLRVKIISRPNRGLVASLNEGLELAEGELIARMDADDISLPDRLASQVAFFGANHDVVCAGGYYDLIDGKGRFLTTMKPPTDHEGIDADMLAGNTPICHPSAMMRRAATDRVGGYDPQMMLADDLDLWLRLGEIGKLANLSQSVVRYRLHNQSVSEQSGLKQRTIARKAVEHALQRRGLNATVDLGAAAPSRPQADRQSRHKFALLYGWWAFNSGYRRTALSYGIKSVALLPFNQEGHRLLACAAVKKLPA